jgi:hypothetical protein
MPVCHSGGPEFDPRPRNVGFVIDKVSLGQISSGLLQFPLSILIPPNVVYSSIIRGWYNRPISGSSTKWTQSHPTPRNFKKNLPFNKIGQPLTRLCTTADHFPGTVCGTICFSRSHTWSDEPETDNTSVHTYYYVFLQRSLIIQCHSNLIKLALSRKQPNFSTLDNLIVSAWTEKHHWHDQLFTELDLQQLRRKLRTINKLYNV